MYDSDWVICYVKLDLTRDIRSFVRSFVRLILFNFVRQLRQCAVAAIYTLGLVIFRPRTFYQCIA